MPEQVANYTLTVNDKLYQQHYIEFDRAFSNIQDFVITNNHNNIYTIHHTNTKKITKVFNKLQQNINYTLISDSINHPNIYNRYQNKPEWIIAPLIHDISPKTITVWQITDDQNNIIQTYQSFRKTDSSSSFIDMIAQTTDNPKIKLKYRLPFLRHYYLKQILNQFETSSQQYDLIRFIDNQLGVRIIKVKISKDYDNLLIYYRQKKPSWIQHRMGHQIAKWLKFNDSGQLNSAAAIYITTNQEASAAINTWFLEKIRPCMIVSALASTNNSTLGIHTKHTSLNIINQSLF